MKPFSAVDLTLDKHNETPNGAEFCCAKPSEALAQALENATTKATEIEECAKLPLPLRILQGICYVTWLICFVSLLRGLGSVGSIQTVYQNASWIFWVMGGTFLVWGVLAILSLQKKKSVMNAEGTQYELSRVESIADSIYAELGVPAGARETDVFFFFYKNKKGQPTPIMRGSAVSIFVNLSYHAYADEENLYLTNLEGKFAFPKSSLKTIRTVKKHICFQGWNKNVNFNEAV